jgi:hypothetical protein
MSKLEKASRWKHAAKQRESYTIASTFEESTGHGQL